MLKKLKVHVPALLAAAVVATAMSQSAQATTLNGGIDIVGSFTSTDLLGGLDANLLNCTFLNLGLGHLDTSTETGVFAGLGAATGINLVPLPILCKPLVVAPVLSSFTLGAYTFTVIGLALDKQTSGLIELGGLVTISDGNLLDLTTTTATIDITAGLGFDLQCGTPGTGGTGGTGGSGNPSAAPDSGTSVALFGCGLMALGAYGRMRQATV